MTNCSISGVSIKFEISVKLAGGCIDDRLSFCDQEGILCRKDCRQINAIMRLSRMLDIDTKLKVYYMSFMYSTFLYCPAV